MLVCRPCSDTLPLQVCGIQESYIVRTVARKMTVCLRWLPFWVTDFFQSRDNHATRDNVERMADRRRRIQIERRRSNRESRYFGSFASMNATVLSMYSLGM